MLIRPSTGCFLIVTWFSIFYLVLGTPKNVYLLDKSVILSPSIYLSNGKCNLVITEIRFSAFYLINFVLVKMINIFSYNKGNFVATRSHRSWFILFEKIRSDHPNWYGELFRVCARVWIVYPFDICLIVLSAFHYCLYQTGSALFSSSPKHKIRSKIIA